MIRQGLARLRSAVRESRPNVLLLVGDDQNENYTTANSPQFSIFVGESFTVTDPETNQVSHYRAEPDVAARLLREGVDAGFDLASTDRFDDDRLRSHAHCEPLRFLDAAAERRGRADLPQCDSRSRAIPNAVLRPWPTAEAKHRSAAG